MANNNDSFKQITDARRSMHTLGVTNMAATTRLTQTIADSLKIHNDRIRAITDTISGINNPVASAFKIYNEQIANAIRPFDIAGVQFAASTSALQKIMQDHHSQINVMFDATKSAMAINIPPNIFNDQLTRTFNIIPKTMFANIDFARIQIPDFDDLTIELNDIDLEEEEDFDLTEEELKNIRGIILDIVNNSSAQVHDLLNALMQFAHDSVVPKLKAAAFVIVMAIINHYIIAYISMHYPSSEVLKLLNLSYQQKIEVIEQNSQELIKQQSMQELSKYRLVCVVDLHVRSGPSIDAPIKSGLLLGDKVKIIETNEEWVRIQWSNNEGELLKGWVKKRYLTEPKIDQPTVE